MKILVTSAKSNISKKIIMDLKKNHDVISTDVSGQNNHNFVQCQLDELHDTDLLLKDVDIIINIGYDGQSGSDKILIDYMLSQLGIHDLLLEKGPPLNLLLLNFLISLH